jgi:hypothetical protein
MKRKYSGHLLLVAVLLLAGAALLASACGGSDDTTATTAAATETAASVTETTAVADTAGESANGTSGNVVVKGLVDNPRTLTAAALEGMAVAEITVDHPKLGPTDYRGVRCCDLCEILGVQEAATTVVITASDGYMVEMPLADIHTDPDAMLTIGDDGTLTVVIPSMESKNWVKDVVTIEFK